MKKLLIMIIGLLLNNCSTLGFNKDSDKNVKPNRIEDKNASYNRELNILEDSKTEFIPYDKAPIPINPVRPIYPQEAKMEKVQGTVYVRFFIDINGNVTEAYIQKGVSGLDEAAVQAVKLSKWKPAKREDKNIGAWLIIPIRFQL